MGLCEDTHSELVEFAVEHCMLCGWEGPLAQERTKLIQWAKD